MTNSVGQIIEGLVAILLVLTIGYCMMLNRRLKLLKADEHSLRATISELVTATEIAERAIAGLKLTVEDCELGLSSRLRSADRCTTDLDRGIAAGKELVGRLSLLASAGATGILNAAAAAAAADAAAAASQGRPAQATALRQDPQAVAAAAQAFAERLRMKVNGVAA